MLPVPAAPVADIVPCADGLAVLVEVDLGGDTAAAVGLHGRGARAEIYEVDLTDGAALPLGEPAVQRDQVAALACHDGRLLLPIR